MCRSQSVRITVGKGADNSVVPTVRTETPSSPFFEKSQIQVSMLPRGVLRRKHHLLASTLVIHTTPAQLWPECSVGKVKPHMKADPRFGPGPGQDADVNNIPARRRLPRFCGRVWTFTKNRLRNVSF